MLAPFLLMSLTRQSPCKVNLLLNILGRRPDGFHELESVIQPVPLFDELEFQQGGQGVQLTCSEPALPTDSSNLVHRAASAFLQAARIAEGVSIHLRKRIPLAAGLGGGSGNAANTLVGLNHLFGHPLPADKLSQIAATLGSDVPFFLQDNPVLAAGRGERIAPLDPFPALRGVFALLVHPGFGISTAWAYQTLARYPHALNGRPSRAQRLIALLKRLEAEYRGTLAAGQDSLLRKVESISSYVRGKRVHVDEAGGYDGITEGLDARGFLRVRTAESMRTVLSGGVRAIG